MTSRALFLVLVLAASSSFAREGAAPVLPIEGIWLSDRDLTLAELQKAQTWPERQWKALSDPALFGHMVQVIHGHTLLAAFDGRCETRETFDVLESGPSAVRVRFREPNSEPEAEVAFRIVDGNLHVPIAMFPSRPHEVYRRATLEEATREQPCLAQVLRASQ